MFSRYLDVEGSLLVPPVYLDLLQVYLKIAKIAFFLKMAFLLVVLVSLLSFRNALLHNFGIKYCIAVPSK